MAKNNRDGRIEMKRKVITVLMIMGVVMSWFSFARADSDVDAAKTIYDFSLQSIDGTAMPLSAYRGKAILLVNTASQCGFTPQYDGLQKIWQTYRDRGLVVIATPANNFNNQEPGSNEEIKKFCAVNFNVDFPMSAKIDVIGKNADPVYQWVSGLKRGGKPKWNFYKYLFNRDGVLIDSWSPVTKPDSDDVMRAIEGVL
jgi:glutathione peroxidase